MTEKISFMERSEYMTEEGGRGESSASGEVPYPQSGTEAEV
ncbi:MAG: hypothetical protein ACLRT5_00340 [Lachnospiraceae bacterium]